MTERRRVPSHNRSVADQCSVQQPTQLLVARSATFACAERKSAGSSGAAKSKTFPKAVG
jgi:hypothetical protein